MFHVEHFTVLDHSTSILIDAIQSDPSLAALASALDAGWRVVATGAVGSSTSFVAAALAARTKRPVVLIVAHIDDAEEVLEELTAASRAVVRLPALEVLPGETGVSLDLFAERLSVVRALLADEFLKADEAPVIVCPIQGLMQLVPPPSAFPALVRTLERGKSYDLGELNRWLAGAGYTRKDAVEEPGDFAVRGGILDIFPSGSAGVPARLDFFGDQLDKLTEIDLETMGSDRAIESLQLVTADEKAARPDDRSVNFLELLPRRCVAVLSETLEIVEQARGYFERVTDSRGIVGPPAVLKIVEQRFHALAEVNQFSAGAGNADVRVELPVAILPAFSNDAGDAVRELAALAVGPEEPTPHHARRVIVTCQNEGELQRFGELTAELPAATRSRLKPIIHYVHRGFLWQPTDASAASATFAVVPYHELLNRFTTRRRAQGLRSSRAMDTFLDFQPGDYVVHVEHGICRFFGLQMLKPRDLPGFQPSRDARQSKDAKASKAAEPEEYLTLEFAGKAKLHVPVSKIDQVQKYVGGFSGKPPLSTLGGERWKGQKARAAESVRDLAAEMLRVRAAREHMPGIRYPGDTAWQTEFEAEFPYEETADQLAAMAEIKRDMQSAKPMDRLICGDVGFGKTELAIRAAFKACEFGKQVAVLVPTTVLAEQHERTFRSRFAGYPFRVESLSRFKSTKEVNETLSDLRRGQVDLVIGTHRILSADVRFADLGLVIIDEEQRFGVEHKEQLLRLRLTVDVLTLSATPIPRTLHMAMLGIRDISSLTTAPLDRRAIVTEVIPYNEKRIAQAIARELSRNGQIYFVHNRVQDISSVADNVRRLAPEGTRIVVGHGQMQPHELEEVMLTFMRGPKEGGADILVATTIIESGIDIPTANTMFINDADRFGLADLHQLRGRVGRSRHRAYCYMLLAPDRSVREIAQKRLKAIEQYSMLGAGFKIAMRDLEIRGAGNLLGEEQSGHIALVGYDMYCQLLERAVKDLNNEKRVEAPSATSVEIGVSGTIPKPYIPSDMRRLEAYRRIATATSREMLAQVETDLTQAYGQLPKAVQRLMELAALRVAAAQLDVRTITIREKDVIFRTAHPKTLEDRLNAAKGAPGTVTALAPKSTDDLAEVYFRPPEQYLRDPETLLAVLRKRLG